MSELPRAVIVRDRRQRGRNAETAFAVIFIVLACIAQLAIAFGTTPHHLHP